MRLEALKQYNDLAQKSTQISEEEKQKIYKETHAQEVALNKQKIAMVSQTLLICLAYLRQAPQRVKHLQ